MKANELKEELVKKGVETEDKARVYIRWHRLFFSVSGLTLISLIITLLNITINRYISYGILILTIVLSVTLADKYMRESDVDKLKKAHKVAFVGTIAIAIFAFIYGFVKFSFVYNQVLNKI